MAIIQHLSDFNTQLDPFFSYSGDWEMINGVYQSSNYGQNNTNSVGIITFNVPSTATDITIEFDWLVSSEQGYDIFTAQLTDFGYMINESGEVSDHFYEYIGTGDMTLTLNYSKDASSGYGNDIAWIDNLTVTYNLPVNEEKILNESILITDLSITKKVKVSQLLVDSINIVDSPIVKMKSKQLIETIALLDSISKTTNYHLKLTDVIIADEHFTKLKGLQIIGSIQLKGSKTIYVYLKGTQSTMNINLLGEQRSIIKVKGGIGMTMFNQNFSMFAGEEKNIVVTVTKDDGNALDLTNTTIIWGMRSMTGNINVVSKSTPVITIASNILTVPLVSSDTQSLNGNYIHECKMIDTQGHLSTLFTGFVTINKTILTQ